MSSEKKVSGEDWFQSLQADGLRITAPRRAVVETLVESEYVLNPLEIFSQARKRYPKLGLVTVYRTLDKLENLGLVERVHQPEGCQGYIAAQAGHHHLVICEECGRAAYFSGDRLGGLVLDVEGESGFQIRDHWLQLYGTCGACR
jgi:Fe2+ or Zn2+ uptake regulation protein